MLDEADRRALLALAREAARAAAEGRDPPPAPQPLSEFLAAPGAAFVTLRRAGDLRGCVGHIAAHQPLWASVREMGAAAAVRDDRFPPVAPADLDLVTIEISVLSPMIPVSSPDEVLIGRHGLYLRLGPAAGLLLPQVAVEHGWTAPEFLAQLCRKAGLPQDAWTAPECRLQAFSAEVFREAQPTAGNPRSGEGVVY